MRQVKLSRIKISILVAQLSTEIHPPVTLIRAERDLPRRLSVAAGTGADAEGTYMSRSAEFEKVGCGKC